MISSFNWVKMYPKCITCKTEEGVANKSADHNFKAHDINTGKKPHQRSTSQKKSNAILLIKEPSIVRRNAFFHLQYCEEQNWYYQLDVYIYLQNQMHPRKAGRIACFLLFWSCFLVFKNKNIQSSFKKKVN